jgi:hypothetical protein
VGKGIENKQIDIGIGVGRLEFMSADSKPDYHTEN